MSPPNIFMSSLAEKTAIALDAAFYLHSMIAEKRRLCNAEYRLFGVDRDAVSPEVGALIDPQRRARRSGLPGQHFG